VRLNASGGHKVLPAAIRNDGDKAEPHPILRLLAEHRADADNIDAAQVLKRILGDCCILARPKNRYAMFWRAAYFRMSESHRQAASYDRPLPAGRSRTSG
jgi:hypothetical protein